MKKYSVVLFSLLLIHSPSKAEGIKHEFFDSNGARFHAIVIDRVGYDLKLMYKKSATQSGKLVLTQLKTLAEDYNALAAVNGTVWQPKATYTDPKPSGYYGSYDGAYLNTTLIDSGNILFSGKGNDTVLAFKKN